MMKTQSYKKGWAFTLTLALAFTTLFGGFGFLGINGVVGEVYADTATAYTIGAPAGTTGVPKTYAITTEEQLRGLATTVSSDSGIKYENTTFELMEDIAISDTPWIPIGTSGKPFSGTFDGKNRVITGIQIGTSGVPDSTYSNVGLFGYTSGSAIKNLGVNVQIYSSSFRAYVGGLVGQNYEGTITNCYVTGNVTGGTEAHVGGLVGYNYGYTTEIINSYVTGGVTGGTEANIGGLVGLSGYRGGIITNCYATGQVTGENGATVGGLVGKTLDGTIMNCYATGNSAGGTIAKVGGLCGFINSDAITNCYATGDVTGGSDADVGGLAGFSQNAAIRNCYATGNSTGGTNAQVGGFVGEYFNATTIFSYWNSDATQMVSSAAVVNKLGVGEISSGTVSTTSMTSIAMTGAGFVTTLNNWVSDKNVDYNYTWKADSGSTNGGYPIFDAAYVPVYAVSAATNGVTANGVTATATFDAPSYAVGTTATVTITLSGTATAAGTHAIGLTSAGDVSSITAPASVTKTAEASVTPTDTYQFTFTMPASVVDDLVVTHSFTNTVAPAPSGGSGSSTPATPIINTNTGSVTGNQLKNAANAAKVGGTVTIKSADTSEVTLPNSGLDSLAGKNNSLTVVTENGTLTFDSKAVGAIGTQATATDIKVIVDDVVKTTLTEEQQTKVGDKTVYDLSVMSGGKLISSFNGGKVNVNIPYDLKTGETAENLTVWYMADDGSLTEINCTYDAKNKAVTFVVDHFSKYIIGQDELADWANPFTDVKNSAWYYNAAAFVNVNGLMKGQTDTTFGPQTAMTRGMFVTILGRMEGVDTTKYADKNTFSDVKSSQYYAPYIAWANDKGIVTGMGGDKFAPNAAVTREQMAVMMTNYMKLKGQGPTGAWAIQLTYGDLDKVSSWANEGVMFMTMKDLMNGMGNDTKGNPLFAPKSTSTRAQTAQVMMNLGELLK